MVEDILSLLGLELLFGLFLSSHCDKISRISWNSLQAKKIAERNRKKEEVRKRLEEASRAKRAKKGFLTPERKKKLRVCEYLHNSLCLSHIEKR